MKTNKNQGKKHITSTTTTTATTTATTSSCARKTRTITVHKKCGGEEGTL